MTIGTINFDDHAQRVAFLNLVRQEVRSHPLLMSGIIPEEGACAFYAEATRNVLLKKYLLPEWMVGIAAGSARWRMVAPEHDDGVGATHFAYEYQPGSAEIGWRENRAIEFHSWVMVRTKPSAGLSALGMLEHNFILDTSTSLQPKQAARLGVTWDPRCPAPDMVAASMAEMVHKMEHEGTPFEYGPSQEATGYFMRLLREHRSERLLVLGPVEVFSAFERTEVPA
jgi:hypothetical protein